MESSGVMEGSKKQSEGLVRDYADHSNIGDLRDYLHHLLSEEQEHGFEISQQAVKWEWTRFLDNIPGQRAFSIPTT